MSSPITVGSLVRHVETDARGFETITTGRVRYTTEVGDRAWAVYVGVSRRVQHPDAPDLGRWIPAGGDDLAAPCDELVLVLPAATHTNEQA